MALICDTGPLYAAMDIADQDHVACARLLETTDEQVLVPAPVVVELDWLVGQRLGPDAFLSFLADSLDGLLEVVDLQTQDYLRVRELLDRYRDLGLGFVDAASSRWRFASFCTYSILTEPSRTSFTKKTFL